MEASRLCFYPNSRFLPQLFFGLKKFVILKKPVATLQSQEMEISKSGSLLHYSHKHVWKIVLWHSCHFHNIFERHLYSKDDSFVFHTTRLPSQKRKRPNCCPLLQVWALFRKMGIITDDVHGDEKHTSRVSLLFESMPAFIFHDAIGPSLKNVSPCRKKYEHQIDL